MIYLIILISLIVVSFYYDIYLKSFTITSRNHNRGKTFAYFIFLFIFVFLAGFRNIDIGDDTQNYLREYLDIPLIGNLSTFYISESRYQPFWLYLMSLSKSIFNDFSALLLIETIIVNIVLFRFFKKFTSYPFICITLYFTTFYIQFNTEIMREAIAVAFCLLAYEQYLKKRWIIAILLWYISFNFHISAMIGLLFPLFAYIKYSKKNLTLLATIGIILLAIYPMLYEYTTFIEIYLELISPSMADMYNEYSNFELDSSRTLNYYIKLFVIDFTIPIILIIYLNNKSKWFGFISVYIIFKILTAFTYAFHRFGNYELAFYIIFLGNVIKTLTSHHKKALSLSLIKYLGIILLCLITFQNSLLNIDPDGRHHYERYIPYKSIFEN